MEKSMFIRDMTLKFLFAKFGRRGRFMKLNSLKLARKINT